MRFLWLVFKKRVVKYSYPFRIRVQLIRTNRTHSISIIRQKGHIFNKTIFFQALKENYGKNRFR